MYQNIPNPHLRNNAINSKSQKNNPVLMKNKLREIEFLQCLGNGKTIYQIEMEESLEGDQDEI